MTASVLVKALDVELETIPVPPLEADEVLVQIAAVGVCGSASIHRRFLVPVAGRNTRIPF